jgi:hypothetical protein
MRASLSLLTFLAAAPLLAQPGARAAARLPSFRNTVLLDTVSVMNRSEHEAPPAVVWPLLAESVKSIDPELATAGGATAGWLGTLYLVTGRRLGDQPLSRWLECGVGMTGRYADTHRIALAFAVFVDSLPNQRTRLSWALVASATERGGQSNNPLSCETTGALELEIRKRIDNRLAMRP